MPLPLEMDVTPPPADLEVWESPRLQAAQPLSDKAQPRPPGLSRRLIRRMLSGAEWIFGIVTLIVGLAVLSIIPVLNLLSLGYLLEASGRVGRTGRLRSAFVGVRKAAVLGRLALGSWLVFWPSRIIASLWHDAQLIAPNNSRATGWHVVWLIVTTLTLLHIAWACLRGGKLRHFLWPAPLRLLAWIREGGHGHQILDTVLNYLAGLRLLNYFRLGFLGFVGAIAWLAIPVGILIGGAFLPPPRGALLGLLGGGLLFLVTLYLPFLQAHFATENRFRAMFELRHVRQLFQRAPLAFWLALLITLLFALPLYLLKIEFLPKEIEWLPSLLFVTFIFPARMLTGWAISRARRRETPRHWFWRWTARLGILPLAFAYVLLVYITQYLSWNGTLSLLEQHAFLVPAPMISL